MKIFLLGLFLTSFAVFQFNRTDSEPAGPPKVIAKFDKISNGFIIHENILKKTFADGSKIERFSIQKDKDGVFLIRQGIDSNKQYRSEAFRLKPIEKDGLKWVLDFKLKWYTVCSHGSCWCHKIGNDCECAEGGGCLFGQVPTDGDIEIIVIA